MWGRDCALGFALMAPPRRWYRGLVDDVAPPWSLVAGTAALVGLTGLVALLYQYERPVIADVGPEVRRLWPLARRISNRRLPRRPPLLQQRFRSGRSTGQAWDHERPMRIEVAIGRHDDAAGINGTVAHEVAHLAAPATTIHGRPFWATLTELVDRAYGVRPELGDASDKFAKQDAVEAAIRGGAKGRAVRSSGVHPAIKVGLVLLGCGVAGVGGYAAYRWLSPGPLGVGTHFVRTGQRIRLRRRGAWNGGLLMSFFDLDGREVDALRSISVEPVDGCPELLDVELREAGVARLVAFEKTRPEAAEVFVLDSSQTQGNGRWLYSSSTTPSEIRALS